MYADRCRCHRRRHHIFINIIVRVCARSRGLVSSFFFFTFDFIKSDYAISCEVCDWDCLHFSSFVILTGSTTFFFSLTFTMRVCVWWSTRVRCTPTDKWVTTCERVLCMKHVCPAQIFVYVSCISMQRSIHWNDNGVCRVFSIVLLSVLKRRILCREWKIYGARREYQLMNGSILIYPLQLDLITWISLLRQRDNGINFVFQYFNPQVLV